MSSRVPNRPWTGSHEGELLVQQLIDTVPCLKQTPDGPAVALLPEPDSVRIWVDGLTMPYGIEFSHPPAIPPAADGADVQSDDWWTWAQSNKHVYPGADWARKSTTSLEQLVENAAKLLSSSYIGNVVVALKQSDTLPPDWQWENQDFLAVTERLFNRLWINHFVYGDQACRTAVFWGADGETPLPRTVFAHLDSSNPWRQLRGWLSTDGSALGDIVGLSEAPGSFTLPLQWSEAVHSGLIQDQTLTPRLFEQQLNEAADNIEHALTSGKRVSVAAGITGALSILAPGGVATLAIGALFLFSSIKLSKLVKQFDHWPNSLRVAAGRSTLPRAVADLLAALRQTDLPGLLKDASDDDAAETAGELLLGLEPNSLRAIEVALGAPPTLPQSDPATPMILLGHPVCDYASDWNDFEGGTERPQAGQLVRRHRQAKRLFTEWWNKAQPSLDVARMLDTASILLEQLIYIDDATLAANDLATGDGVVTMLLRRALADLGLDKILDGLGGASPGAAARFFVRQFFTDGYFDWAISRDYASRECLRTVFPWMGDDRLEGRTDAALGPLTEVTENEPLGLPREVVIALRLAFGIPGDGTLHLRAVMLPDVPAEDAGALRRVVRAFIPDGANFAHNVSGADLGTVRDWLTDARTANLVGLRERLEPEWQKREPRTEPNEPTLPDELPELPDRSPEGPLDPV